MEKSYDPLVLVDARLGIDLGGTKIAAVVLDESGGVLWETRVPTPRGDYDATIAAIAALVADAEGAVGRACTVGIGMPGAISPATGLAKNANSTWLNGRPFDRDLQARLQRPVALENDANCLALSEAADGAAAGAAMVFAVILGTGTGGGVAAHGRIITGANAIGGEWGHNPLPWPRDDERPGPPCYCGKSGCIETFLSGPGLLRDAVQHGVAAVRAEDVVARAAAGDAAARDALRRWHDRLARALATVINVIDPEVVVFGGGMSRVIDDFDALRDRTREWVFSDALSTRFAPARHGDASGVRGAARLWSGRSVRTEPRA